MSAPIPTIEALEAQVAQASSTAERLVCANALALQLFYRDPNRSLLISQQTLAEARAADHLPAVAEAYRLIGMSQWQLSRYSQASEAAEAALDAFEKLNDTLGKANIFSLKGNICQRRSESAEALAMHRRSLELYESIGDHKGMANSCMCIGNALSALGEITESLQFHFRSLRLCEESPQPHPLAIANSRLCIGNIYASLGDYAAALEYHLPGLAALESLGDKWGTAASLNNIGYIYDQLGDYDKALEHHTRSLSIRTELGEKLGEATSLHNLGSVWQHLNDLDQATACYERSLTLFREVGNVQDSTACLVNLGMIHFSLRRFTQADDALREALTLSASLNYPLGEMKALNQLGKLYHQRGETELALQTLHRARELAEALGATDTLYSLHLLLSTVYESQGNLQEALNHHRRYHQLTETVFNSDADRRLKSLTVQYDVEGARRATDLERLKNTELAAANSALREANAFKTELLGIAAHDLKNPLQSIMGFAELVSESHDLHQIYTMTGVIQQASMRMLNLIDDLLNTASIDAGRLELHRSCADLSALMRSVVDDNLAQAQRKQQTLHTHFEMHCTAFIDTLRFREVLENLVSNAVKYTPHGKRIWIEMKSMTNDELQIIYEENSGSQFVIRNSQFVIISVRDEGHGLSEDDLKKLFGKFQRLSARPTGGESSTGLGLSIAKQLVELHDGRIWATSQGKGEGATFYVALPLAAS